MHLISLLACRARRSNAIDHQQLFASIQRQVPLRQNLRLLSQGRFCDSACFLREPVARRGCMIGGEGCCGARWHPAKQSAMNQVSAAEPRAVWIFYSSVCV